MVMVVVIIVVIIVVTIVVIIVVIIMVIKMCKIGSDYKSKRSQYLYNIYITIQPVKITKCDVDVITTHNNTNNNTHSYLL
jgi:flagellar basal body-associated protein FliL